MAEPKKSGILDWVGSLFKPKETAAARAAEEAAKAQEAAKVAAEKARTAATQAAETAREAEAKADALRGTPSGSIGGAPAAAAGRTYVVQSGDSLSKIAKEAYGSGARWTEIYEANKALIGDNPNMIHPGQTLRIP